MSPKYERFIRALSIIVFLLYLFSWKGVFAATIYSQNKIGTNINIGMSEPPSTRYYGYYFGGATLANPPNNLGYWTSTQPINKVRVKKISGSCNDIGNAAYLGYLVNGNPDVQFEQMSFHGTSYGDYCDATTYTNITFPVGTKFTALSIAVENVRAQIAVLDGSPLNDGISVNGNNDGSTPGGFAFQLCSDLVCFGGCGGNPYWVHHRLRRGVVLQTLARYKSRDLVVFFNSFCCL
jgi:hypothetical protein